MDPIVSGPVQPERDSRGEALPVAGAPLRALAEIGQAVSEALDRQSLFNRIVTRAAMTLGADAAVVRLLDRSGEWLELVAQHNFDANLAAQTVQIRLEGLLDAAALRCGEPVGIDNLAEAEGKPFFRELARAGFGSMLILPLLARTQPVGTLSLYFRGRQEFSRETRTAGLAFANLTAVALENARLHDEAQSRLRQTETLLTVGKTVSSTLDLCEVVRRASREMVRVLGADMGGAWILRPEGDYLVPSAGYHLPRELTESLSGIPLFFAHPLTQYMIEHRRSACSSHSQADPLFDHPLLRLLPHKSAVVVPMWRKDDIVGVFVIGWMREFHVFMPDEMRVLEGIATVAATAVENARLVEAEREGRQRLGASEARYRELFEDVSDIIYLVDLKGRILSVNAAAAHITGYRLDELHGMDISQLVAPEDALRSAQWWSRLIEGGAPELTILEFVRKDGGRVVLECGANVLFKGRHAPAAVQGIARDITVRRQLERRQAAFMEIVRELATHQDSDRLFPRIGQWVCELLRVDGAFVALAEGGDLVIRGAHGIEALGAGEVWNIAQSRLGAVVRSEQPEACPDMSRDPDWCDTTLVTRLGYRAILVAPIAVGTDVQGVLCAFQKSPRSFLPEDVALLGSLSAHTAVALDRARLVRELKTQLAEKETLLNVSQAIGSSLDLVETMRRVARETARALDADTVGAYLADPDHRSLHPVAGYHVPRHLLDRFTNVPIRLEGHRVLEAAWTGRRPVWTSAADTDPLVDAEMIAQFPHRSSLFVPMIVKGEPIGGLFAAWWDESHSFTDEEIRLVEGISRQGALTVEHARLYQQLAAAHEELETLAGVGRELAQTLDLDQVIGLILQRVVLIARADVAYIALTEDGGNARVVACHGQRTPLLERFVVRPGSGLAGRALDTGEIQEGTDGDADLNGSATAEGAQTVLVVPLKLASRHVGLLWLGRRTAEPFGDKVKSRLQRLNLSLAVALDNARLYKQVADKTIEMTSENSALSDALQLQAEFLNNTSHELRTPLTAILGLLGAVLRGLCTGREEEREFIADAHACADELQVLINNVLDMAKVEAGKLELDVEAVDLEDLFEGLRRLLQGQVAAKPGLTLTLEAPVAEWRTIPADAMRLKQVLLNLLNNSLKFTTEGAITVRAVARPDAGFMTITVTDTGIGVPPDRQGRLFQKFVQGDGSTTRSHGGTGLGLAISKRLVEIMGGVIALESRGTGYGTTVRLSLPLSKPHSTAAPAHGEAPLQGPNERPLILLVEDNDDYRDMLRDFLHAEGFQTVEARTAVEGLDQAARLRPSLVITDLALTCVPEAVVRNGMDLIVALSDRPGCRGLPMIMLTGAVAEAQALLGTRAGLPTLRILEKPIDLSALRVAIDAALETSTSGVVE